MIIIKLFGGLGNQLFQYAIGRKLSLLHSTDLRFDLTDFNKYKNTYSSMSEVGVGIKKFKINFKEANFDEKKNFFFIKSKLLIFLIKKISSRYFSRFNSFFYKNYFYEKSVSLFYCKFSSYNNAYFHGFWQNENYFLNIRKTLIKEINLKKKSTAHTELLKKIKKHNSVAVHIRRGDFLLPKIKKISPLININYYKKSFIFLEKKIKKIRYFFFSDDINWVKKNIKKKNSFYVSNFNEVEDLISISKCKHQIIANSTFSWWGAWLNNYKKKIVISPKKWSVSGHNPCPLDWKRIL
jgi:hypothetical protein